MTSTSLPQYQSFVDQLDNKVAPEEVAALLDGQAGAQLRELVPIYHRRALGAFFTPHALADALAEPLQDVRGRITIVDSSCGAGDILLASLRSTSIAISQNTASVELVGVDIVREFVTAADKRIRLQAAELQIEPEITTRCGDGRNAPELALSSHVLLNPPFAPVIADPHCDWAAGTVNGAADFLASTIRDLPRGVSVSAILPDVLRSGRRYQRWRQYVGSLLDIQRIEVVGRFDRWTDVDVFVLSGTSQTTAAADSLDFWTDKPKGPTVGDFFAVSVGSVVNYRDPKRGQWAPYMTAKGFPTWETVKRVERSRRFNGRLHTSPMVVIPRTSRPEEQARARGAIVTDDRSVAVDNHLIVAAPTDGTVRSCKSLIEVLSSSATSDWLNQTIRCRHLTVGAIKSIPWSADD